MLFQFETNSENAIAMVIPFVPNPYGDSDTMYPPSREILLSAEISVPLANANNDPSVKIEFDFKHFMGGTGTLTVEFAEPHQDAVVTVDAPDSNTGGLELLVKAGGSKLLYDIQRALADAMYAKDGNLDDEEQPLDEWGGRSFHAIITENSTPESPYNARNLCEYIARNVYAAVKNAGGGVYGMDYDEARSKFVGDSYVS